MKIYIKIILLLIFYVAFIKAMPVFAADLFFESSNQKFAKGEEFLVNIFLNTEQESISAMEGKISFPENLLEATQIQDGNSIINFWIERPDTKQPGSINFSGIIPGGYHQSKGFIFSIVFKTKTIGSDTIEMKNVKVLLNDGKGTSAKVALSPYRFSISDKISTPAPIIEPIKDTSPPEEFKPEISQNPDLFNGKWFFVFASQDKGSGIDHYEIKEGIWGNFAIAQSPYLLQNQKLDQKIFIKAFDKNGNERVEIFYPKNWHAWYKNYWIIAIIILTMIFIVYVLATTLWKRYKR